MVLQAVRELGFAQVMHYGIYRLGLACGHYRRKTPVNLPITEQNLPTHYDFFDLPDKKIYDSLLGTAAEDLINEAEEILAGRVRLFGGPPVDLDLASPDATKHWTRARLDRSNDVKAIWEPARFGWAFILGRAFHLSGDERFAEGFWTDFEEFTRLNPVNCGLNWTSGQEVALRLIALVFAGQIFAGARSTDPHRTRALDAAIASHARRILPTLAYARAQNNNHLISEAFGLALAGWVCRDTPEAARWENTGWRLLNQAFQTQIAEDGTYIQQSLNYHRLMLHLGLLTERLAHRRQVKLPEKTDDRLQAAARWLLAQMDETSGGVPNLGSNDGANFLALAMGAFQDYRPVAQAAVRAFLGKSIFPQGPWDELALWLGFPETALSEKVNSICSPAIRRLGTRNTWGTLRAVTYHGRPAHADQLQVELWHEGENILRDAGTFSYNAPPPWQNGLTATRYHNAIVVDNQSQMQPAGRFLWLNWANGQWLESQDKDQLIAEHDGYKKVGVIHRRSLQRLEEDHWRVSDWLLPAGRFSKSHPCELNWLLPDWAWQHEGEKLTIKGAQFSIQVDVRAVQGQISTETRSLLRAGVCLLGDSNLDPLAGWYSPTYFVRQPALTYRYLSQITLPALLQTDILIFN